jgi:hypothetical protein
MITNHHEKDNLAKSMKEEGDAEHIYLSADLDWLPPRPRFIPCLPESFCFSFGDPFIHCHQCCSSAMKDLPYQKDHFNDSHNNIADVRKHILTSSSSSPGQASNMEKEHDNSVPPNSSSFLLEEESPSHPTSGLGHFPVRSVTSSHGQAHHHHSHCLLDAVPTLSCIDEDDTEVSEESSCPDLVGQGPNHNATALQPHHHLLPPGAEFLFRFCQFLFSILVVDQMNKLNRHGKKRRPSTPQAIHASTSLLIKE